MSAWIATTTVSILRGASTDAYGDETDTSTVVASGIPASIIEQTRDNRRKVDSEARTVRRSRCRMSSREDVRDGDRIKDEVTDEVYAIEELRSPRNPVTDQDHVLELIRNT